MSRPPRPFASKLLLGHSDTGNDRTGEPQLYTASDRSSADADADVSESVPKRRTTMAKRRVLQRRLDGTRDGPQRISVLAAASMQRAPTRRSA